ncbi:hypothetical protein [Nocardia sp. NPDC005998]|uniref:hypothetical protein n=1 Tax=Nocardia sp. NPDC005998 TaxID=3156894 RepID=UPI0033A6E372
MWTDLWDELYHQHSGENACAALPELAEIASSGTPADRLQAVELAGALIASAVPYTAEIRDRYASEISAMLREVRSELVEDCMGDDHEPDAFVYRLQSMLAFEETTVWSQKLDGLVTGEFEIECPMCFATMFLVIGKHSFFTCWDDYALGDVDKIPLVAAVPDQLTDLGDRLYRLAVAGRQHTVARQLTFLFGRATCPENAHEFTPADAVTAAATY